MSKIQSARVVDNDWSSGWNGSKLMLGTIDGCEETIFGWYPDEINFDPSEINGLTKEEALDLHMFRDVQYLTT